MSIYPSRGIYKNICNDMKREFLKICFKVDLPLAVLKDL